MKRENKAISAVAISCPERIMPLSTRVTSRFLSLSIFIRLRPAPSHRPFRNSRLSISIVFLNSSMWTRALAHCATASANAGSVEVCMLGGVFSMIKKDMSECPSSDLPEPLGPNRFKIGKDFDCAVTTSRKRVANKKHIPIFALSPNTSMSRSQYLRRVIALQLL